MITNILKTYNKNIFNILTELTICNKLICTWNKKLMDSILRTFGLYITS